MIDLATVERVRAYPGATDMRFGQYGLRKLVIEDESKTFLLDGHVPISNNKAERSVKPFAIMRRNVLLCKTESGAEIAARLFTIVQTAKANGLIPEKYIEWCIENSDRPADELLPWSKHVPDDAKALKGKL